MPFDIREAQKVQPELAARVRPLFVSPGHLIDIPGSARIVLQASSRLRVPEPLRRADALSRILSKA